MSQVCAISIYVKDLKEGAKFYSEVLGLKVKTELPYLILLDNGEMDLVLCQAEEPAEVNYPNASTVVLGFPTEDLAKSMGQLKSKGVALLHSTPQDFPGGKFVAFRDPSGNVHELLQFEKE